MENQLINAENHFFLMDYEFYIYGDFILASKIYDYSREDEDAEEEDEGRDFALFTKSGEQLTRFIYSEDECKFEKDEIELCRYEGAMSFVKHHQYSSDYYNRYRKVFDLFDGKGNFITGGYTKRRKIGNKSFFLYGGCYAELEYTEDEYGQEWEGFGHSEEFWDDETGFLLVDKEYNVMLSTQNTILHKKLHYDEKSGMVVNDNDSNDRMPIVYVSYEETYRSASDYFLKIVYKERNPDYMKGFHHKKSYGKDSFGKYVVQTRAMDARTGELSDAYDAIGQIGCHYFLIMKDNKIGVADISGIVLPCKYVAISMRIGEYLFLLERFDKNRFDIKVVSIYNWEEIEYVNRNVSLHYCKRFFNELIYEMLYSSEDWDKKEAIKKFNSKSEFDLNKLLTNNSHFDPRDSTLFVRGWFSLIKLNMNVDCSQEYQK